MGARFSASQRAATTPSAPLTAKVISPEGQLREYVGSLLTVSDALTDCSFNPPSFFLCDADVLLFDEPVPSMSPEESLLPGRLYFVLPEEMSRHPLSGSDMGALASRAAAALKAVAGGEERGRRGVKKNTGTAPSKSGRKCRVNPMLQLEGVGDGGDIDIKNGIKRIQRMPASSQLKINRATAAARRRAALEGKKKVGRRDSLQVRLGTINEDAAL